MGRGGFSLFEVLVSLAVIALMASVVLAARSTPSPGLELNAIASELIEEAARLRTRAVTTGTDQPWAPTAAACSGTEARATFYADGTADALEICITESGQEMRLRMNVLIGRLAEVTS